MATEELFYARVRVSGMCWVRAAPGHYGNFDGKRAHRWIWERRVGPIPPGLQIDHLCNNPPCVKLAHLDLVTPGENMVRSVQRGRKIRMHPEATDAYAARSNYRRLIEDLAGRIRSGSLAPGTILREPGWQPRGQHVTRQGWRATCSWLVDYGLVEKIGDDFFVRFAG